MSGGGIEDAADRNVRLADYVLGQMDDDATVLFERDMTRDPALADEVSRIRESLLELDADTAPLTAPEALWARIAADARRTQDASATFKESPKTMLSLWGNLGFWRATGMAATAAALLAFIGLGSLLSRGSNDPVLVAVLVNEAGMQPGAIVEIDRDGMARMITLADIPVPADRALQVWTLQDRQTGPRSVALIQEPRSVALNIRDLPPARADQLFEITLEPETGSPTGRPTGPILYKGTTSPTL
jgi:anti-sigma-K factor RskA